MKEFSKENENSTNEESENEVKEKESMDKESVNIEEMTNFKWEQHSIINKDNQDSNKDEAIIEQLKENNISKASHNIIEDSMPKISENTESETLIIKNEKKREITKVLEEQEGESSEGEEEEEMQNKVIQTGEKYSNPLMNKLQDMIENPLPQEDELPPESENKNRKAELSNQLDQLINKPELPIPLTPSKDLNSTPDSFTPINEPEPVTEQKQTDAQKLINHDSTDKIFKKPRVPKQPKFKKKKVKKVADDIVDEDVVDYSHIFNNFYEIFNSYVQHPKTFDPSATLREVRNLYSSYISLMDSNILFAAPQFKFEAAPLEK